MKDRKINTAELREELKHSKMELTGEYAEFIQEGDRITCINRFGNEVSFGFDELWLYITKDEEYVGCTAGSDGCEHCLTPIC